MNIRWFGDEGASLVEYALLLSLLLLVCLAAVQFFGGSTALSLSRSGSSMFSTGS